MNIKIADNKYVNALLVLMLFSAIVHMIILFVVAIASRDMYVLNYFNILDVDLFHASIFSSGAGNLFALVAVVGIYLGLLKFNRYQ